VKIREFFRKIQAVFFRDFPVHFQEKKKTEPYWAQSFIGQASQFSPVWMT
jgi:hypothetical protein